MVKVEPLGHTSFKISGKNASLVVNPFCKEATGLEWKKRTAELVLVTGDEAAYNNVDGVAGSPYVIAGSGEYEVQGVRIYGIALNGSTFYQFKVDNIVFLYLGGLNRLLQDDELSELEETDVLFVPIGGVETTDPEKAAEVVAQIEPKIAIPMHYQWETEAPSGLAPVEKFIEEMGEEVEKVSELKLKSREDLPEETEVIVLE